MSGGNVERMDRIVTIGSNDSLVKAAEEMRDNRVGSLVVVDRLGVIVGILTERDVVGKSTALGVDPREMRVAEIMTTSPVSCTPDTSVSKAQQAMVAYNIRHLPVVKDGRPVGMISSRDILESQLQVNKAMKRAAEQVARMGKSFKSLDFDEVMDVVVSDVPDVFQARRALLFFEDDQAAGGDRLVCGKGCPWCQLGPVEREHLIDQLAPEAEVSENVPAACKELGAGGPRVVIALPGAGGASDGEEERGPARSFLCMCGLPPAERHWQELLEYEISLLGDVVNVFVGNARLCREARRDSLIDALTGLGTRRALEEKLAVERQRAIRHGHSFCVIMADVDNFKVVNDCHGHLAGDRMLGALAKILRAHTRAADVVTRYGGDEFVVLMPETALEEAMTVAERLRCQVSQRLTTPYGEPLTITCGVAEWSGRPDDAAATALQAADRALYQAKRAGRDRVVAAAAAVAS